MSRIGWIIAAVAVLIAVVWLAARPERGRTPAKEAPPAEETKATELVSAPVLQPPVQAEERTPAEPAPRPASALAESNLCEIKGRFVLPGGAPAASVPFEVHGWESNEEDVRKYGLPDHWADLQGETDADGRFSVRFDPPRAYQFTFEAKTPDYAGAEWRWGTILAGEVVDLGEVELVVGGTVEGRIVDADGRAVRGNWYVYARSIGLREFDGHRFGGRDETQVTAWAEPATGRFRVEDVMPGRVELSAQAKDSTEHTVIQVRSGETVEADILVKSREASRRISVDASSEWLRTVRPDPQYVTLTGADGVPRSPKSSRFSFRTIVFDDVEPGQYRLSIDDPRFRPWSCLVRPGADFETKLQGTSALAVRVRGPDGEPIEDYALRVQLRNVTFSPAEFEPKYLVEGFVGGVTPGDYRLTVRAGEHIGSIDVDGLGLGETRAVEVLVGPECIVSGQVRYSDGKPAAEIELALLPATPVDSRPSMLTDRSVGDRVLFEKNVDKETTDEHGSFRFAIPGPGEYVVYASASSRLETVSEVLVLGPGEGRDGLELVLPRGGIVAGRILAPPGASCEGLRIWIGSEKSAHGRASVSETARELSRDGGFELGPIQPGQMTAYLLLPIQRRRTGRGGFSSSAGLSNHVVLGTVEVVDGERVERDFEVPEFPGTVALTVLVNDEAVAGVSVEFSRVEAEEPRSVGEYESELVVVDGRVVEFSEGYHDRRIELMGETDARGHFGPTLAFPGAWTVSLRDVDAGWRFTHPTPVLVAAASESRAQVSVQVAEASLLFLDAESGAPLAERVISLLGPLGDWTAGFPWLRRKADAHGRASWTLASGEYRFRLETGDEGTWFLPREEDSEEKPRTAPVIWTLEGPHVREVRL